MPIFLVDFCNIVKNIPTSGMRVFLIEIFPFAANYLQVQVYVELVPDSTKILD